MSLLDRIAEDWPSENWADVTVLVAISGGPDSVALLRGLCEVRQIGKGRLVAAHFNHRLRPEAEGEAEFVAKLSEQLEIECHLGLAEFPTRSEGDGIEAAARAARYDFLLQTAEEIGARYVATAHTRDDQVETILQRIIRGTGLGGLAGIPRTRRLSDAVTLIRPMLDISREEVVAFLNRLGQAACEDATNREASFTRNRIRLELLPELRTKYNPRVDEALLRLGQLANEANHHIDSQVAHILTHCCPASGEHEIQIDIRSLRDYSPYLVRETLIALWRDRRWPEQGMGYNEWDLLAAMIRGTAAERSRDLPGGIRVELGDGKLLLREKS